MKLSYFIILFFLPITFTLAQIRDAGPDCSNLKPICGSENIKFNPQGKGINDFAISGNIADCFSMGENNSAWYKIRIAKGGTFTFLIAPQIANNDYDFGIWGPNVTCNNLGSPIRCNTAAAAGTTGLTLDSEFTSQGPGNGSNKCKAIEVKTGEEYYILIDNASRAAGNSFDLTFGGTATLGEVVDADFLINPTNCGATRLISRASSCTGQRLEHQWTLTDSKGVVVAEETGNENPAFSLPAGTYKATLNVKSLAGTIATTTKTVEIADAITANLQSVVNCNQVVTNITATSCYNKNFSYEWNILNEQGKNIFTEKTKTATNISYLNTGVYTISVKITNDLGTTLSKDTVVSLEVPSLQVIAPEQACFEDGQSVEMSAKIISKNPPPKYEIEWYNKDGAKIATGENTKITRAGIYKAVLNYESCKISSNFATVKEYCLPVVYVPTAFSPNADGLNDNLRIWGKRFVNLSVEIYDQWGTMLFSKTIETENENISWNGIAPDGVIVPSGMYVVQTHYFDASSYRPHREHTVVAIIR
jgi:gliding motility-associated-like protein